MNLRRRELTRHIQMWNLWRVQMLGTASWVEGDGGENMTHDRCSVRLQVVGVLRRDCDFFSLRLRHSLSSMPWVSTFQFSFRASDICRTDISLIRPLSRLASPFRSLSAPICALLQLFWMLLCHPSSIPPYHPCRSLCPRGPIL